MSTLYQRDRYLNKDVDYIVSNEIIEYDIQSAGFNILKHFKLLSDDKIQHLESLGKKQKQIQIGLYQRDDKDLAKKLTQGFTDTRKWFFDQNGLEDADILSIKKDAIVTTKRCLVTEMGELTFAEKNIYTSYYHLNNLEFYYNKDTVDVKGISDDQLVAHREYMLDFLYNFFKMNEISSRKKVVELLNEFAYYYKRKDLEIGYYRELNIQSLYQTNQKLFGVRIGVHNTGDKDMLDISYNYMHYVVPLISILV